MTRLPGRMTDRMMAIGTRISDEEIAEGYILACCSRPRGRVEIDA